MQQKKFTLNLTKYKKSSLILNYMVPRFKKWASDTFIRTFKLLTPVYSRDNTFLFKTKPSEKIARNLKQLIPSFYTAIFLLQRSRKKIRCVLRVYIREKWVTQEDKLSPLQIYLYLRYELTAIELCAHFYHAILYNTIYNTLLVCELKKFGSISSSQLLNDTVTLYCTHLQQ